jgi:hypothetical protein
MPNSPPPYLVDALVAIVQHIPWIEALGHGLRLSQHAKVDAAGILVVVHAPGHELGEGAHDGHAPGAGGGEQRDGTHLVPVLQVQGLIAPPATGQGGVYGGDSILFL